MPIDVVLRDCEPCLELGLTGAEIRQPIHGALAIRSVLRWIAPSLRLDDQTTAMLQSVNEPCHRTQSLVIQSRSEHLHRGLRGLTPIQLLARERDGSESHLDASSDHPHLDTAGRTRLRVQPEKRT